MTPDGSHVGLFWYDRRLDRANNLIDRFGAIGTVSGHTVAFGANFRITDVSFPPVFTYWTGTGWAVQDPVVRPGYMGDYDQAVADNNNFYTTSGDNRLADAAHANQPDVRFAKIPVDWLVTGALSATSLASASTTIPSSSAITAAFSAPLADLSSLFRSGVAAKPTDMGSATGMASTTLLIFDPQTVDQYFAAMGLRHPGPAPLTVNLTAKPHSPALDEDWLADVLLGLEQ